VQLRQNGALFNSFLGILDLKLGVTVISFFAVLNKLAGVYGVLALFTGAGTFAQISLYVYSIGTLPVLVWGIKMVSAENAQSTFLYANLFALDHLINTFYICYFAQSWYLHTPHDGRRTASSDMQRQVADLGDGGPWRDMTPEERMAAAESVWMYERGFSAAVLVAGWLLKLWFISIIYSYAIHLRRGSYHSLPLSMSSSTSSAPRQYSNGAARKAGYKHLRMNSDVTDMSSNGVWDEEEGDYSDGAYMEDTEDGIGLGRTRPMEVPPNPSGSGGVRGILGRLAGQ